LPIIHAYRIATFDVISSDDAITVWRHTRPTYITPHGGSVEMIWWYSAWMHATEI